MGPGPEGRQVVLVGTQWTDNVARVYEVVRRHPEISVEWPRWSGRKEFRASWPSDPSDEGSEIRSVQTLDVSSLASRLEQEFPD